MTTPHRALTGLAPVLLLALASCGGVKTATRADTAPTPTEPFLVQVVDQMPEDPVSLVSLSVLELDPEQKPPPRPAEDTVQAMRRAAAAQGAELLVLERVVMPWRKAFYGFGIRKAADGPSPRDVPLCSHPDAREGLNDALADTLECVAALKWSRPGLSGRVVVSFQVDAFGDVYRAASTPESSRDSEVQRCALRSVVKEQYGDHTGLLCRLELEATL